MRADANLPSARFVGRVPVTAALSPLSEDELVRVLCGQSMLSFSASLLNH
jgi:hypothetical protein